MGGAKYQIRVDQTSPKESSYYKLNTGRCFLTVPNNIALKKVENNIDAGWGGLGFRDDISLIRKNKNNKKVNNHDFRVGHSFGWATDL